MDLEKTKHCGLVKEQSNKMTTNDISRCPQFSVLPNHYQKSFLHFSRGQYRDSQMGTCARSERAQNLVLHGVSLRNPSSHGLGNCWGDKDCKKQRTWKQNHKTIFWRCITFDVHLNPQRLGQHARVCTRPREMRTQHGESDVHTGFYS